MTTTTTAYLVKRFRAREAAPSLSLSYEATSPHAALLAHFAAYPGGVADGTRYEILSRYGIQGMTDRLVVSTTEARAILRRSWQR